MAAAVASVSDIIDEREIGPFQKWVIVLCAAIAFAEGIQAQLVGYIAPSLMQDFGLTPAELGLFLAFGPLGTLFGAMLVAPLADIVGRRPVILASVVLFGLGSLGTAASSSVVMLDGFRLLTGVGIGGAMANIISLTSEYSPARRRSTMVAVMLLGFIVGATVIGVISSQLVPLFGWRSVLIAGGALSLLLVPVLYFALPESIRFLSLRGSARDQVVRLLKRIDRTLDIDGNTRLVADERKPPAATALSLFREGRAGTTILLWTIYFMSLLTLYLLSSWVTTHVRGLGVAIDIAILIGTLLQVGGMFGTVFGWVVDRFGPGAAILAAFLIGAVAIASIGFAGSNLAVLAVAVFFAGFGIIGGQAATNALAALSYPTSIRSTGVGWASGVGRVGSITGPGLAGILVGMNISTQSIFFLAVVPPLCAAIAAVVLASLKRQTRVQSEARA